jgi:pyruvate formate lyase activating enzyme
MSAAEIMGEVEKDSAFYEMSSGGVTISGGEPLQQPHLLAWLLRECKSRQFHTVVETSGYGQWTSLELIANDVDLFLYDVKVIDPEDHQRLTGVSNAIILDNLRRLSIAGHSVLVRTPLIPSCTTSTANLHGIASFLQSLGLCEIELLPYNRLAEDKYSKLGRSYSVRVTDEEGELKSAATKAFAEYGIRSE